MTEPARVTRRILGMLTLLATVRCGGASSPPHDPSSNASSASPDSSALPDSPASEARPTSDLAAGVKAFDQGRYEDARSAFDSAAKKNPTDSEALYNLGLSCEKLGDRPAAERAFKAALAAKPSLESASVELSALAIDEGHPDEAISVARAGLAGHGASAPLHENLGAALAAQGDQDAAKKELEEAARLSSTDPMLQLTLAHWLNVWRVPGAVAHLDTAAAAAKDDYPMLASIGLEYRMAGDFTACIQMFDRAVAIKDAGEVRTERALCRHGLKDAAGTMNDLKAAVRVEPTYAPAHFYLAGRLATAKQFKAAAAEYAKYLELAPNGSLAASAQERLKAAQQAAKGGDKGH